MLITPVVYFLLACAGSLTSAAIVLENGMPILWPQTFSQVNELPIQNEVVTPDPWNYLHRMSFYRLIITATDPYMGYMGTGTNNNPFWGQSLQLGWLLTSGRFVDPTGATVCGQQTGDPMCISTQSWWGCMTYYVSALSFLSAAQQGFFGEGVQVQMQVPASVEDYCTTYADCFARHSESVAKWDAFFQGVKTSMDAPISDNDKMDTILGLYWAALTQATSSKCDAKSSHYSAAEESFIMSWQNSVDYLAASHFHTNLERAHSFAAPLPSRVLQEGDKAPNIADLSQEENHTISVFSWMNTINSALGGLVPRMWRNAMCSVSNREKGRQMMEQLLLNPAFATSTFVSIIAGMATSC